MGDAMGKSRRLPGRLIFLASAAKKYLSYVGRYVGLVRSRRKFFHCAPLSLILMTHKIKTLQLKVVESKVVPRAAECE